MIIFVVGDFLVLVPEMKHFLTKIIPMTLIETL